MSATDRHAWTEPGVEDLGGGVHRIPLPLPMDGLKAVNVYAITDAEGVDLIDAGIALVQARERLTEGLRQIGYELGDIRNFFVTHIHIDHYSLAVGGGGQLGRAKPLQVHAEDPGAAGTYHLAAREQVGPLALA